MSKELVVQGDNNQELNPLVDIAKNMHDDLKNILSKQPDQSLLKQNKFAGNSTYLPIDHLESMLDTYFERWDLEVISSNQVFNHMCTLVRLTVYRNGKVFAVRDGSGARPFQANKGANPFDPNNYKPNAVEQAFTTSQAFAFRNAVQKLGNLFGRNLNRKSKDYSLNNLTSFKKRMANAQNVDDLSNIYHSLPSDISEALKDLFAEKKKQLLKLEQDTKGVEDTMRGFTTLEELKNFFVSLSKEEQRMFKGLKDELKDELS